MRIKGAIIFYLEGDVCLGLGGDQNCLGFFIGSKGAEFSRVIEGGGANISPVSKAGNTI